MHCSLQIFVILQSGLVGKLMRHKMRSSTGLSDYLTPLSLFKGKISGEIGEIKVT